MTTPVVTAAPPPLSAVAEVGRWSSWSDRLNAILVRELQQAVKGRMFALAIVVAMLITVVIATVAVGRARLANDAGRGTFDAGLATLVPLVLFIVPMQAYQSMRLELRGGIVEQLLLSRLRPRTILVGKLQAAMVQFVLFVAVLSPLLATSYLLRGVDLPTIGVSLAFALVFCLVATALAVSSAAQGMSAALQPVANLAVGLGLGIATFATVGFVASGQYARMIGWMWSGGNAWPVTSAILLLALSVSVLSLLVAQSHLLHTFENRSTGFRVFLFVCPAVAFGWMCIFVPHPGWDLAVPVLSCGLLLLGTAFAIFMVTEQRQLSARVCAHVPKNAAVALLAAPFLPGRDRGLGCYLLYVGVLSVVAFWLWPAAGRLSLREAVHFFELVACYAVGYLMVVRWVRGRLPETIGGNHAGRILVPVLLLGACIVPVLVDVFVRGRVESWHFGHVLNPFWTIERMVSLDTGKWARVLPWLAGFALGALLLQLRPLFAGMQEVRLASLARRRTSRHG